MKAFWASSEECGEEADSSGAQAWKARQGQINDLNVHACCHTTFGELQIKTQTNQSSSGYLASNKSFPKRSLMLNQRIGFKVHRKITYSFEKRSSYFLPRSFFFTFSPDWSHALCPRFSFKFTCCKQPSSVPQTGQIPQPCSLRLPPMPSSYLTRVKPEFLLSVSNSRSANVTMQRQFFKCIRSV